MLKSTVAKPRAPRFLFMLLGLGVSCPLTYVMAYNLNISFGWLMLYLFISVCLILFIDFRKETRASFFDFVFRVILSLLIGFTLFYFSPVWVSIVTAVYILVLLSVLAYAASDMFHKVGAFCLFMFGFNLIIGLLDYRGSTFAEYGMLLTVLIVISTISMLSFFIILNVDTVRWFGADGLKIPKKMKYASFAVIVAGSVFLVIISLSPWLAETGWVLLSGMIRLINTFFSYIYNLLSSDQPPENIIQPRNGLPAFDIYDAVETEPHELNPVFMWLVTGIIFAAFLYLIVISLFKFIRFLLHLYKTGAKRAVSGNEVFIEIIEKITRERKKRLLKGIRKRPAYSSLLTERERIIYIYREYVRRAKRSGFTYDSFSDTPNEVLGEIEQKADGSSFPPPGDLNTAFNTVRYSNENIRSIDAYQLKQRLL